MKDLYLEKTVKGGLSREKDVRVPEITMLSKGGNFGDSILCIAIENCDQMMTEDEDGGDSRADFHKIYIEMNTKIAQDLINKLTFVIKNHCK